MPSAPLNMAKSFGETTVQLRFAQEINLHDGGSRMRISSWLSKPVRYKLCRTILALLTTHHLQKRKHIVLILECSCSACLYKSVLKHDQTKLRGKLSPSTDRSAPGLGRLRLFLLHMGLASGREGFTLGRRCVDACDKCQASSQLHLQTVQFTPSGEREAPLVWLLPMPQPCRAAQIHAPASSSCPGAT